MEKKSDRSCLLRDIPITAPFFRYTHILLIYCRERILLKYMSAGAGVSDALAPGSPKKYFLPAWRLQQNLELNMKTVKRILYTAEKTGFTADPILKIPEFMTEKFLTVSSGETMRIQKSLYVFCLLLTGIFLEKKIFRIDSVRKSV